MSQFIFFSSLPNELKDMIWDQAIRDDEPAAQFFTIHNAQLRRTSAVPPATRVEGTRSWYQNTSACHLGLAAPQVAGNKHDYSWVDGNMSAYMTDSGLWTACYGSRLRMLRHFKPAETSALASRLAPVEVQRALELCRRPTATVTMPFRRDNGERQYLTIQPMKDLLYFHFPVGEPLLSPRYGYYWQCLKNCPLFRWQRDGGGWHSPLHIRHIAVQYDPTWMRRGRDGWWEEAGYLSGPKAEDVAGLERFWYVNYALRRRYRIGHEDRRDRETFRAGGDREFVEVLGTDAEWWDPSSGGDPDDLDDSGAHSLARMLQDHAGMDALNADLDRVRAEIEALENDTLNNLEDSSEDNDENEFLDAIAAIYDNVMLQARPRFGVLACVERGSEQLLPTRTQWIERRQTGSD